MSLKWNLCSCNTYRTYHIQCTNINAAPHSRWWCVILQVWYYYLMRSSIFFIKMHFQHFFALQSRPFCGLFSVYTCFETTLPMRNTRLEFKLAIFLSHSFHFDSFLFVFWAFVYRCDCLNFRFWFAYLFGFFLLDANGFLYFSTNKLAVWIYCTDFGDPPFWFSYIQS